MPDHGTPSTESLIEDARREAPTPEAQRRGLDAVLEGQVEPIGVDGPSMEPRAAPWLFLTMALLVVVLGAALAVRAFSSSAQAPVAPVAPVAPIADAGVAALRAVDEPERPVVPRPDQPPVSVDAGRPAKAARPPAPRDDDSLARELALLDEARVALGTEPARALEVLDRHRREFPRGSLGLEASLLRVETLLKLDRRADAEALARQLERADREGLVRERLERLLPR